jgi:hypothetical protein
MRDDRVKEEIEEILERVDDRGKRGASRPRFRKPPGGRRHAVSLTGWLVVTAVFLLITALVFRNMFLGLAIAGAALLLIGYWLAMRSSRGGAVRVARVQAQVTPPRLLVAALIALLVGIALRRWFVYFGALAFFLFLWAYWIAWPKRPGRDRRWRSEVIDYPESFWTKVRRWIRGR